MKIKIKSYNAVASWRWNIKPKDKTGNETTAGDQSKSKGDLSDLDAEVDDDDDDDEEEDVCGICRVAFEGTCPNCKIPGDDCPLIFGKCTHIFHLHCLLTWLNSDSSKNQCPLDRQPWVTAGGGE